MADAIEADVAVAVERGAEGLIYLDHNGTTPVAPEVLEAMLPSSLAISAIQVLRPIWVGRRVPQSKKPVLTWRR